MALLYFLSILSCFVLAAGSTAGSAPKLHRFPRTFFMGFATASYQIEGAWNVSGKGESIWDRVTHAHPEKILDHSNGDVTCNSFYKYKEDIALLKSVGADVYRFSISWPRILPKGDLSEINLAGITFYNNMINDLLISNIKPMVTIYHWDLPQVLQDLGGWTNPIMVDYFGDYARFVFETFGDRVKMWITFNEPFEVCAVGYGSGSAAPALKMSGVADYLCGHTLLKSHALAYHIYDNEFKKTQKGVVGITLDSFWCEPLTDSKEDRDAAELAMEFQLGWFLHPILKGTYPPIMRANVDFNSRAENRPRSRLPHFNDKWKEFMKGTMDFLGVNHYTSDLTTRSKIDLPSPSFERDQNVSFSKDPTWPGSSTPWLRIEPTGFRKKLVWLKNYMGNTSYPMVITENGYPDFGEPNDVMRINYHRLYLKELLKAIYEDKCNVLGYIVWSLLDNFEWFEGYTVKFGAFGVDFNHPSRRRYKKASFEFFRTLMTTKILPTL